MTAFLDSYPKYPKYYMHLKSTLNTPKRQIDGVGGGKEGLGFSEIFDKLGGGGGGFRNNKHRSFFNNMKLI